MHRYFFYKRLLIYYRTLLASKDLTGKKYCAWIRQRLKRDAGEMERVYGCPEPAGMSIQKMKIFLRSAVLYRMTMWLNEKLLLPVKTRGNK